MTTIRLLLADDQALVRGALAALLDLEADLHGRRRRWAGATRCSTRPASTGADVALLDVEMPGLDGIAAAAVLRGASTRRAGRSSSRRSGAPATCGARSTRGASGFVVKDTPADQLADAVRRVHPACGWSTPTWPSSRSPSGESR